ncbi:6844_t:CDS:2 [Scutellospora calospora]|uniref:6844_t:CDS:1 n=1 Tax=Scutellospora calospora TaxID=85575 RepID=A0ACA9KQE2_9GLOM|nr:6844_t:CDS:2 [Scutellospora calospora]
MENKKKYNTYSQYKRQVPENKKRQKQWQERDRIVSYKHRIIETKIEQEQRKERDKLAHHKRRNQTNDNYNIELFYLGPHVICNYCEVKKFVGESNSLCCNNEKIVLSDEETPPALLDLFIKTDKIRHRFRNNI